jgi:hypothetical protein
MFLTTASSRNPSVCGKVEMTQRPRRLRQEKRSDEWQHLQPSLTSRRCEKHSSPPGTVPRHRGGRPPLGVVCRRLHSMAVVFQLLRTEPFLNGSLPQRHESRLGVPHLNREVSRGTGGTFVFTERTSAQVRRLGRRVSAPTSTACRTAPESWNETAHVFRVPKNGRGYG